MHNSKHSNAQIQDIMESYYHPMPLYNYNAPVQSGAGTTVVNDLWSVAAGSRTVPTAAATSTTYAQALPSVFDGFTSNERNYFWNCANNMACYQRIYNQTQFDHISTSTTPSSSSPLNAHQYGSDTDGGSGGRAGSDTVGTSHAYPHQQQPHQSHNYDQHQQNHVASSSGTAVNQFPCDLSKGLFVLYVSFIIVVVLVIFL